MKKMKMMKMQILLSLVKRRGKIKKPRFQRNTNTSYYIRKEKVNITFQMILKNIPSG